jgi:Fe2+ or Zn2+ uptake regulation protein
MGDVHETTSARLRDGVVESTSARLRDGVVESTSARLRDGVVEAASTRLRDVGQRLTPNRATLLDALANAPGPLTIPAIRELHPELAQSSAYRNLVVLEEAGIVHRVAGTDEFVRWELAEDLAGHHHHLICASCGRVDDVPASAGLERSVAAAAAAITRSTGFITQHHRIDLVGLCRDCA